MLMSKLLELTVNTAKLADAQYDLNTALTAGIAGLTSVRVHWKVFKNWR